MLTRLRLRLVALTRTLAKWITAFLLTVGLTMLYFVGIGLTWVVMNLFRRRELFSPANRESFWVDATDYAPTLEESSAQS